jgi:tetratricopeptide (TPR) repeat protein
MGKAIPLLILLFFFSPSYGATIYQWVDNNGTYNFTDDYEKVPSVYRNQVHLKKMKDIPEMGSSALPSTPKAARRKEEVKADILGLGEEWWREKVHPWEGQLREASENYQAANEEFLNESDKLILRKFGSHQQFKSTIIGMDRIREERAKYEAKVIEAEEMLEKISKQAEESKADPDWLTGASTPGQQASLYTAGVDIYGRDEAWWRQKVLVQREQVKEAVENYEKAYEEYSKEAQKLGPSRFGGLSLTQYQMTSLRLEVLKDEMGKYRLQISEATEILKNLVKEAEESKADPEWVE